jgi:hypothetical protein
MLWSGGAAVNASPNRNCPRSPFFGTLTEYDFPGPECRETNPFEKRKFMNADLRRRSDEVLNRLTQLRDSL